jgi:hypothetical protein
MIGRSDSDGIDRFVFEDLPHVLVSLRLGLVQTLELVHATRETLIVHIANRYDLEVVEGAQALDVISRPVAGSEDRDAHGVAGIAERAGTGAERGSGTDQKITSIHEYS